MKQLLSALAVLTFPATVQAKPNFVILFSDDAGYADFDFQPDVQEDMQGLTPHIASIASQGARFSNAYMSAAVCSSSRAGLMTGRYQQRFGHENNLTPNLQNGLPLSETFGAERLRQMGYQTGLIGKWHLGYPKKYHPNRRGFDWFYGLLRGSRRYFPYEKPDPQRVIQENGKPTPECSYVTDRIGDSACRFIREHKDEAFFLFVSFTAPHGPPEAKSEDLKQLGHIEDKRRRGYAGLVKSLDDNVGKILETLHDTGLSENTLLVFTNDNGGPTSRGANNFPLKGKKGRMWEGGIRVPLAIRWPGRIKPGIVVDDPIISLDLLPTCIAAAGKEVEPEWQLDGINLVPRITEQIAKLPHRTFFWRQHGLTGQKAIRDGEWKLVLERNSTNGQPELYHLTEDTAESKNLAADHPEKVDALLRKLEKWESQLQIPLWGGGSIDTKDREHKSISTAPLSSWTRVRLIVLGTLLAGLFALICGFRKFRTCRLLTKMPS